MAELYAGGFRMRYANYLTNYGDALARSGDFASGHAYIDEAISLSKSRGQFLGIPEMLRIKGDVYRLQGAATAHQAHACYSESMDAARQQGALSWELRTAISLVELGREHGQDERAEQLLAAAFARFTEGFETGDLMRARALLGSRRAH